jgi:erythromycin esterase-like protein
VGRLDARIDAARIVALGELDHWIAEKSAFRLWWIERLLARSALVLAEELGHSDGVRVARYLESGDESWLDRVPTFGWRGDVRHDRDDRPSGVLSASFERYPTARFKAAQCAFYRRLRALGVRDFHGIDVNAVATSGYADVAAQVESIPRADVAVLLQALTAVPGETVVEEADRLARVRAEFAERGPEAFAGVLFDVEHMESTLRYQALAHGAPDYAALAPALALREAIMKRATARVLDALDPPEKLVLMGHALHLAKDDARLDRRVGVGPGGNRAASLGHHLVQERGERVFSVWFLFGGGEDCQPFPDLPCSLEYPEDSLNARLSTLGGPAVIDTATAPAGLLSTARVGHLYNLVVPMDLAAQTDALFFLPRVTPLPHAEGRPAAR